MTVGERETPRSEIRADLIKRLFAVAISIGFATTLAKMDWLREARLPHWSEWQQLFLLLTALVATVLSWDGYLLSIRARPLNRPWRFLIDVFLVFIYMGLLIVSPRRPDLFAPILAVIFLFYVAWDILSIAEYIGDYGPAPLSIVGVYCRGLFDTAGVRRGPVITAVWFLYFLGLAIFSRVSQPRHFHVVVLCAFTLYGLSIYRLDKAHSFRSWRRLVAAGLALLATVAAFRVYRI